MSFRYTVNEWGNEILTTDDRALALAFKAVRIAKKKVRGERFIAVTAHDNDDDGRQIREDGDDPDEHLDTLRRTFGKQVDKIQALVWAVHTGQIEDIRAARECIPELRALCDEMRRQLGLATGLPANEAAE